MRVCVATGRMWRSAEPWVRTLGADSPAILYNGGQVLDFATGAYAVRAPPAAEAARAALALTRRVSGGAAACSISRDRVYAERQHPLADAYAVDDGLSYEIVPSLDLCWTRIRTSS